MKARLCEIAQLVQGLVCGDDQLEVEGMSPIDDILAGSLVYADGAEKLQLAETSQATAVLVSQQLQSTLKPLIQVADPFRAFMTLLNYFNPQPKPKAGIHPSAVIAENVRLGEGVYIGPNVVIEEGAELGAAVVIKANAFIGRQVKIGEGSVIHPQVTIYDHCQLGKNVIIHASSVIGSDGFGYTFVDGQHLKVPHIGNVVIGDEVEIGANTVVDRATLGSTKIGSGTKIDNLVQVAHSVKLGKNNILCAFTGIAGSSSSGDNVIFAANVGVSDHVRIDDNVILGARAGVPSKKHLLAGNVYLGNPARPKDKAIEQELSVSRIPMMRKNLRALSEKVAAMQETLNNKQDD